LVVDDETVARHIERMEAAEEYETCLRKAQRAFRWALWVASVGMVLLGVIAVALLLTVALAVL
jgi:hypothetical protein